MKRSNPQNSAVFSWLQRTETVFSLQPTKPEQLRQNGSLCSRAFFLIFGSLCVPLCHSLPLSFSILPYFVSHFLSSSLHSTPFIIFSSSFFHSVLFFQIFNFFCVISLLSYSLTLFHLSPVFSAFLFCLFYLIIFKICCRSFFITYVVPGIYFLFLEFFKRLLVVFEFSLFFLSVSLSFFVFCFFSFFLSFFLCFSNVLIKVKKHFMASRPEKEPATF